MRILETNGVDITNIDGAIFNRFCAGNRDGILKDVENECNLLFNSSNTIAVDKGTILADGIRVVIDSMQVFTFSVFPIASTRYQIILQLDRDADNVISSDMFIRPVQTLIVENILKEQGTYQLEIGRFTATPSTLEDLTKTLDVITGGEDGAGLYLRIGTVETETIASGLDAEVDINNTINPEGKWETNFKFSIPRGEGGKTTVKINGVDYEEVSFTSNPQTQIDSKVAKSDVLSLLSATSTNPVQSNAIYNALNVKQNKLTFDSSPTEDSNNVLTSGTIFDSQKDFLKNIATKFIGGGATAEGYVKLDNGLLIQWGGVTTPWDTIGANSIIYKTVVFPLSFYEGDYRLFAIADSGGVDNSSKNYCCVRWRNASNCSIALCTENSSIATNYAWFAIGRWKI